MSTAVQHHSMTVREAAAALGVSTAVISHAIERNHLPAELDESRHRWVTRADLEEYRQWRATRSETLFNARRTERIERLKAQVSALLAERPYTRGELNYALRGPNRDGELRVALDAMIAEGSVFDQGWGRPLRLAGPGDPVTKPRRRTLAAGGDPAAGDVARTARTTEWVMGMLHERPRTREELRVSLLSGRGRRAGPVAMRSLTAVVRKLIADGTVIDDGRGWPLYLAANSHHREQCRAAIREAEAARIEKIKAQITAVLAEAEQTLTRTGLSKRVSHAAYKDGLSIALQALIDDGTVIDGRPLRLADADATTAEPD